MYRRDAQSGELMTILPGWWRLRTIIPWAVLVGVFIALAVGEFVAGSPGAAVVALTAPVLVFLMCWALVRSKARPVRLEVTESTVRVRQGRWRGHPDMQAPRSEIRAIHCYPRLISFRGLDNKPMMIVDPNYTLRQMRMVAAELGVRLYDHNRWLGLRKVHIGRLAYDPASGPVVKSRI